MAEVEDLDVLRPPARLVRLGEKEIDVSYIPCAIMFEVDRITRELYAFNVKDVQKGEEETAKAWDLTVELCATFCEWKHPKMTKDWFMGLSVDQVNRFAEIIQETLQHGLEAAEAYQKN